MIERGILTAVNRHESQDQPGRFSRIGIVRFDQIIPPISHPHIAVITIDPADWNRIENLVAEARELRLLDLDDSQADAWTVRIGCASERVREAVEDNWG